MLHYVNQIVALFCALAVIALLPLAMIAGIRPSYIAIGAMIAIGLLVTLYCKEKEHRTK